MRTDNNLERPSFRNSDEWRKDKDGGDAPELGRRLAGDVTIGDATRVHSFSGHERNRTFRNDRNGASFTDISSLSGLDTPSDSRAFALLDYDRDGWQDVVTVNANNPLTQLFRNTMGSQGGAEGNVIALRFVGGNHRGKPSDLTNRDGYGAIVEITAGDTVLVREHRCGEGFAAQNSRTMLVGIGGHEEASSIVVRWPSGNSTRVASIPAGTLVTVSENADPPVSLEAYQIAAQRPPLRSGSLSELPLPDQTFESVAEPAKVRLFVTMATWCAACLQHLPELHHLRASFEASELELYGVPVDSNDGPGELQSYIEQWSPPYQVLSHLSTDDRQRFVTFLQRQLRDDNPPLPSTVLVDQAGRVLGSQRGIPTVSSLRKRLHQFTQ